MIVWDFVVDPGAVDAEALFVGDVKTLSYDILWPSGIGADATFTNTAGVRSFEAFTNEPGVGSPYYPDNNIDASVPSADWNAPAADDTASVRTRPVAVDQAVHVTDPAGQHRAGNTGYVRPSRDRRDRHLLLRCDHSGRHHRVRRTSHRCSAVRLDGRKSSHRSGRVVHVRTRRFRTRRVRAGARQRRVEHLERPPRLRCRHRRRLLEHVADRSAVHGHGERRRHRHRHQPDVSELEPEQHRPVPGRHLLRRSDQRDQPLSAAHDRGPSADPCSHEDERHGRRKCCRW